MTGVFDVKDYAAVGDGVADDTAAINAAIVAAGPSKGIVYFPPGIYKIGTWTGTGISNRAITMLPGVTLRGASREASIIKVAAAAGDYFTIIGPPSPGTDLTGLTVENLTFDHNTANNVVSNVSTMINDLNYRASIVVYTGSRITVRNCRFTDIDAVWTVAVNSGGSDITIKDNQFDNYGISAAVHDSSTIYTSGVRTQITDNTFVGVLGSKGACTAIETHGDNQLISRNHISNFFRGMNTTGVATTSSTGILVESNIIRRCSVGIQLWSNTYAGNSSGFALQDAVVNHNLIEVDYDSWAFYNSYRVGISLDNTSNYGVRNLIIENNTIRFLPFTTTPVALDFASAGIQFYRATSVADIGDECVSIENNKISGSPGPGIYFQPKAISRRLKIKNNTITDPAMGGGAAFNSIYRAGIVLQGSQDRLVDVSINDNVIVDTRTTAVATSGINAANLAASIVNGEIMDNILRMVDTTVSVPTFKASATAGTSFYVRHRATKYVAITAPTMYGSQIIDTANGIIYKQTAFPSGTTWVASS